MSFSSLKEASDFCREREIEFVDLRYADLLGRQRHVTLPACRFDALQRGFPLDGEAAAAFRLHAPQPAPRDAPLLLAPDAASATVDPFCQHPTLAMLCDVRAETGGPHAFDPRGVARRAAAHLRQAGPTGVAAISPQLEFFIFDQVCYEQGLNHARYRVDSREGAWRRGLDEPDNVGYQLPPRGGLHALPPADSLHNLRGEIVQLLEQCGVEVDSHHRGPATGGQAAIRLRPAPLVAAADRVMLAKHIIRNAAARHGKTATFMPQPLHGDCGSGMPVCLLPVEARGARAPLAADGIRRHLAALLALCCPTTNSFRRLAARGVSRAGGSAGSGDLIQAPPASSHPGAVRYFGIDGACNPYLAFSALALAAADGRARADGAPSESSLPAGGASVPREPRSLSRALAALEADQAFLLAGESFDAAALSAWIRWKRSEEVEALRLRPHPYEFCLYFDH